VLEVTTTGRYFSISWSRNRVTAGLPASDQLFVNFGEVYVAESTTLQDLGRYEVVLIPAPNSNQSASSIVGFDVISPGMYRAPCIYFHSGLEWCTVFPKIEARFLI
jgi:hypothetical protein